MQGVIRRGQRERGRRGGVTVSEKNNHLPHRENLAVSLCSMINSFLIFWKIFGL